MKSRGNSRLWVGLVVAFLVLYMLSPSEAFLSRRLKKQVEEVKEKKKLEAGLIEMYKQSQGRGIRPSRETFQTFTHSQLFEHLGQGETELYNFSFNQEEDSWGTVTFLKLSFDHRVSQY
jgi:hypothetical protein